MSLTTILDETFDYIEDQGETVEGALEKLNSAFQSTAPHVCFENWSLFHKAFKQQILSIGDSGGGPSLKRRKKSFYSKEVILSAAWSSFQIYRGIESKKDRKIGDGYHNIGSEAAAAQHFQRAININPCDAIATLSLAKQMRDICNLVKYEKLLRKCITISGFISETCKEVNAGWSALGLLALFLCQEGRDEEAKHCLQQLGCQYRLSRKLLHYSLPSHGIIAPENAGVRVYDQAFPPVLFQAAYQAFKPESKFWSEHNYHDPKVGYFSYVLPLDQRKSSQNDIGVNQEDEDKIEKNQPLIKAIVSRLRKLIGGWLPAVFEAESAEFWAHCRCHASGHQMHFDSAFEGETEGGAQNPICSAVLYLASGDIGGPTLVTNQSLKDSTMASDGFLVHPKNNRVCVFKGDLLHGVLPGRGVVNDPSDRRITFMVAFWSKKMKMFPYTPGCPGAAQELPMKCGENPEDHIWPTLLLEPIPVNARNKASSDSDNNGKEAHGGVVSGVAEPVWPVWELVNAPNPLTNKRQLRTPIVPYDLCFQGF